MDCARACTSLANPRPRTGYVRTVVLLHGSAGTSALWRDLSDKLGLAYDVIAPDLIGYGAAPAWQGTRALRLEDEAARIEAAIPCCHDQFHLVGYSYGGAVALCMAAIEPRRIASLALIEPVFFASLRRAGEAQALSELESIRDRFADSLDAGASAAALQDFIDFWAGANAWQRMPARAQAATLGMAAKIRLDWEASFAYDFPPSLAALGDRTLLVRGDRSPPAMVRLVEALQRQMTGSRRIIVQNSGHMMPLTHPAELSAAISAHLHEAAERAQA